MAPPKLSQAERRRRSKKAAETRRKFKEEIPIIRDLAAQWVVVPKEQKRYRYTWKNYVDELVQTAKARGFKTKRQANVIREQADEARRLAEFPRRSEASRKGHRRRKKYKLKAKLLLRAVLRLQDLTGWKITIKKRKLFKKIVESIRLEGPPRYNLMVFASLMKRVNFDPLKKYKSLLISAILTVDGEIEHRTLGNAMRGDVSWQQGISSLEEWNRKYFPDEQYIKDKTEKEILDIQSIIGIVFTIL
jgi:hypothetical protein